MKQKLWKVGMLAMMAVLVFCLAGCSESSQANKESLQKAADEATAEYETMNTEVDTWNELYSQYQSTGKTNDSFISFSKKIVKDYSIEGGNSFISSESFDLLEKRIDEALKEKRTETRETAKRALDANEEALK